MGEQSLFGTHPEPVIPVHQQAQDIIIRQACSVRSRSAIDLEGSGIVPVQAGRRSDPHEALLVLCKTEYGILRQSVLYR